MRFQNKKIAQMSYFFISTCLILVVFPLTISISDFAIFKSSDNRSITASFALPFSATADTETFAVSSSIHSMEFFRDLGFT